MFLSQCLSLVCSPQATKCSSTRHYHVPQTEHEVLMSHLRCSIGFIVTQDLSSTAHDMKCASALLISSS